MQILAVPYRFSSIWCDLNFGDAVLKTTAEYWSLIHALKCDLFISLKELFVRIYMWTQTGKASSFQILWLSSTLDRMRVNRNRRISQISTSVWDICYSPGQSVPAEHCLEPSRHQRAKEKSTVEFRLLLPWNWNRLQNSFCGLPRMLLCLSVTPELTCSS